jgi:hypothetical protein
MLQFLTRARVSLQTNIVLLVGLDPYRDEVFEGCLMASLGTTAQRLRDELRERGFSGLPAPPAYWDSNAANPEPLSVERLIRFLEDLSALVAIAQERGDSIIALGD